MTLPALHPLGLWALVVLPTIAIMHWYRPRARARRVAGLFLWAEAAGESRRQSRTQARVTMALLDISTALLLIALACGVFIGDVEPATPFAHWGVAGRLLLCCAIAALLVFVWRGSAASGGS